MSCAGFLPLLLQAASLIAWAGDPFGITKAIKSWKRKTRKDMWIFARGERRKAVLSWQCNGAWDSVRRATEGHVGYVLTVQSAQDVTQVLSQSFSCPPGRSLLWFWKCLVNVQRSELGLKLSFCSGRGNSFFLQVNAVELGRVPGPSPVTPSYPPPMRPTEKNHRS